MVVLEKPLSKAYPEIDIVTTPVGDDVAMVHVNNWYIHLMRVKIIQRIFRRTRY